MATRSMRGAALVCCCPWERFYTHSRLQPGRTLARSHQEPIRCFPWFSTAAPKSRATSVDTCTCEYTTSIVGFGDGLQTISSSLSLQIANTSQTQDSGHGTEQEDPLPPGLQFTPLSKWQLWGSNIFLGRGIAAPERERMPRVLTVPPRCGLGGKGRVGPVLGMGFHIRAASIHMDILSVLYMTSFGVSLPMGVMTIGECPMA